MIGSAIRYSLERLGFLVSQEFLIDWQDKQQRTATLAKIANALSNLADTTERISLIWSAGGATFHCSQDEANLELDLFGEIVALAEMLQRENVPTLIGFHLLSSAGGLFEGQRAVGMDSIAIPARPYGRLKLGQEELLKDSFDRSRIWIYRPSSVYGPMKLKSGKGLINHLVQNGRSGKVTVLDARVTALRDYVFSQDIGDFVARTVRLALREPGSRTEHFLVSCRSCSIFEVVRKIEQHLKMKLHIRFDENFGNNMDITFRASTQPKGWRPVSLDVGVRQFLLGKQPSAALSSAWNSSQSR